MMLTDLKSILYNECGISTNKLKCKTACKMYNLVMCFTFQFTKNDHKVRDYSIKTYVKFGEIKLFINYMYFQFGLNIQCVVNLEFWNKILYIYIL